MSADATANVVSPPGSGSGFTLMAAPSPRAPPRTSSSTAPSSSNPAAPAVSLLAAGPTTAVSRGPRSPSSTSAAPAGGIEARGPERHAQQGPSAPAVNAGSAGPSSASVIAPSAPSTSTSMTATISNTASSTTRSSSSAATTSNKRNYSYVEVSGSSAEPSPEPGELILGPAASASSNSSSLAAPPSALAHRVRVPATQQRPPLSRHSLPPRPAGAASTAAAAAAAAASTMAAPTAAPRSAAEETVGPAQQHECPLCREVNLYETKQPRSTTHEIFKCDLLKNMRVLGKKVAHGLKHDPTIPHVAPGTGFTEAELVQRTKDLAQQLDRVRAGHPEYGAAMLILNTLADLPSANRPSHPPNVSCTFCPALAHAETDREFYQPLDHDVDDCYMLAMSPRELCARIKICLRQLQEPESFDATLGGANEADMVQCAYRLIEMISGLHWDFPKSVVAIAGLEDLLHRVPKGPERERRLAELFRLLRSGQ
ncbi:hypothetical protein H9P43_005411 [Blastocladiella emersonii ATCC 22665]|nr:hypothetical protein H9P43_005411 [Blastocladiella emersonii ATCC 22665]